MQEINYLAVLSVSYFFPVSVRILNCRSFSVFTFSSVTVSKDFSGTLTKVSSFMHLSFQNKKECFQCIQLQVYSADVRYQTHHNKPEWWCVQCTMVVTRGQYPKIKCSASCLHLSHPPQIVLLLSNLTFDYFLVILFSVCAQQ